MNNDQQIEAAAKAAYIAFHDGPGFKAALAWDDMGGTEDYERFEWVQVADAALEAAHPTITTEAELAALGPGAVVLDAGSCAWQEDRGVWMLPADGPSIGGYKSTAVGLPATVLCFGTPSI